MVTLNGTKLPYEHEQYTMNHHCHLLRQARSYGATCQAHFQQQPPKEHPAIQNESDLITQNRNRICRGQQTKVPSAK